MLTFTKRSFHARLRSSIISEGNEITAVSNNESSDLHRKRWLSIEGVAYPSFSVFFLFIRDDDKTLYSKYIGGDGLEADVIELPDGTHVSLGSKTTFHYDKNFGKDKRIVYLEGEAYF